MFTFQEISRVFPPAAALERLLNWWMAQPGGDVAMLGAAESFFGSLSNIPAENDEERVVDMLRFMEWFLLDQTLPEGDTVLARYTAQAPESEQAELKELTENRHDRWTVKFVNEPQLTIAPVSGGTSITVTNRDLARETKVGEQMVGRFYRWKSDWHPSVGIFFLPEEEQPPVGQGSLGALEAQQQFFMVDPEVVGQFQGLADAFFEAIAAEDEAAFLTMIEPEGEVALVYDVWGWPGVRLLTDWGQPAEGRRVMGLDPDMGATRAEVVWEFQGKPRGATLWFFERQEGFRVVETVPETDGGAVNPAFLAAQDKGQTPAWRAEAPDAVEEKLRRSMAARKLAMLDQGTMIKAWRLANGKSQFDLAQPESWAAAVEAFFYNTAEIEYSLNQIADSYGAKKTLVKERLGLIGETISGLADQPV